jgi:hypothetical protein
VGKYTDTFMEEAGLNGPSPEQESNQLGMSVNFGIKQTPERAAKILNLHDKTGLAPDLIDRNLEEIELEAKKKDFDPVAFQKTSPIVSRWMAEHPNHAALAFDDAHNLSYIERQFRFIGNQFEQGRLQTELNTIGTDAMLGTVTPEQRKRQGEIEQKMQDNPDYGISGLVESIPGRAIGFVPMLGQTYARAAPMALAGAATGAAMGGSAAGLPGAAALGMSGGIAGLEYGSALEMARQEASLAYLDYEKIKDEHGVPLDRETAIGAAVIVGVVNGSLGLIPFKRLTKSIPVLNYLSKDGVKTLLSNPTTKDAFTSYAKEIGKQMGVQGGISVLQQMVRSTSHDLVEMSHNGSIEKMSLGQILSKITSPENLAGALEMGKIGAQAGAGLTAMFGMPRLASEFNLARVAEKKSAIFDQIGQALEKSSTREKSPKSTESLIAQMVADGPNDKIYLPIEAWVEYWANQGSDPKAEFEVMLGEKSGAYEESMRTGQDLVIPTERYVESILANPGHRKFFIEEQRSSPSEMNRREAQEFIKQAEEAQKKSEEEAKFKPKEEEPVQKEPDQTITQDISKKLQDVGFASEKADSYAEMWNSFMQTQGVDSKQDPTEAFKKYDLEITKEEGSPKEPGAQGSETLDQSPIPNAPPFYHKIQRVIEDKMGKSATIEQVRSIIKEVKAEEKKWSGIDDFLKGKEKVNKAELLEFLRGNQIEIEEITRGHNVVSPESDAKLKELHGIYFKKLLSSLKIRDKAIKEVIDGGASKEYVDALFSTLRKGINDLPNIVKYGEKYAPTFDWGSLIREYQERESAYQEKSKFIKERYAATSPRYKTYTLPGGENYKEILFRLPENVVEPKARSLTHDEFIEFGILNEKLGREHNLPTDQMVRWKELKDIQNTRTQELEQIKKSGKNQEPYLHDHWKESNVLAHMRINDRIDSEGKKNLLAEEIQSDWLQEGREKGFNDGNDNQVEAWNKLQVEKEKLVNLLEEERKSGNLQIDSVDAAVVAIQDGIAITNRDTDVLSPELTRQIGIYQSEFNIYNDSKKGVPDAPFRNTWHEFVLKKLLRYAVENGYDKLSWTTGEQQGRRWNQIFDLNEIRYRSFGPNKGYELYTGKNITLGTYSGPELVSALGKDIADRIISTSSKIDNVIHQKITFEKPEAKGMKNFYDKIIPDFLNHFGKKFGAKVEESEIQSATLASNRYPISSEKIPTKLKVHSIAITDSMKESILKEGFSLFQKGDKTRASITRKGNLFSLEFLKNADLSSFFHESGHIFLSMFGDFASSPDANERMKDNYAQALKWLGVESKDQITTEHHEKFAKAYEAWLMRGIAPSVELRPLFARFKAWLVSVYKRMQNLNIELSPEIIEVFDRLFATDEQIEEARGEQHMEPLFPNPESAGMTPKVAARYNEVIENAKLTTQERINEKAFKEFQKEQKAFHNERKDMVRQEVTEEVNKDPIYQALNVLKDGKNLDGSELPEGDIPAKLSKVNIVDEFGGKDRLKTLPKVYSKEGGMHPDYAAERFGFGSGDELLTKLAEAEPKSKRIERLAEQRTRERFGEPLTEENLSEEAMKAIHNVDRAEQLQMEIKHLASEEFATFKGLVKRVAFKIPPIEALREIAKKTIAKMPYRKIEPGLYLRAEKKAAKEAVHLLLKGDIQGAVEAKNREAINHENYMAAVDVKERADQIARNAQRFNRPELRKKIGLAGGDYLNQIDAITDKYSFTRNLSYKSMDKIRSLSEWITEQKENGYDPDIPDYLLSALDKRSYKELTLEELDGLDSTLKQIEHLAKIKNQLIASAEAREFAQAKNEAMASMSSVHDIKDRKELAKEPVIINMDLKAKLGEKKHQVAASLAKVEFITLFLDGHVPNGPMWRNVYKPIADGQNKKIRFNQKAASEMNAIFEKAYPTKKQRAIDFFKKIYIKSMNQSISKNNLLAIALNLGNTYNKSALMENHKINHIQLEEILSHMAEKDWAVVQGVWDHFSTYKSEIIAQEKRINGIDLEMVEATPFSVQIKTPTGIKTKELRGGYYPIRFDSSKSDRAAQFDAAANVKDMFGGSYAKAMTKHGHINARTNTGGRPLLLDLSVIEQHLDQVIHDLSYREPVIDVGNFITDKDIKSAIEQAAGKEYYKELTHWLYDVARDTKRSTPMNYIERTASYARQGSQVVYMGLKLSTALVQFSGITASAKEIGWGWVGTGYNKFFKDAYDARSFEMVYKAVADKSPMMSERMTNRDRDLKDIASRYNITNDSQAKAMYKALTEDLPSAFFMTNYADLAVTIPTWIGAYEKAYNGAVDGIRAAHEQDSIDYADSVIRITQGSGDVKDLSRIQRGSEIQKLFTMFFNWWNTQGNQAVRVKNQYSFDKNKMTALTSAMLLWFLPPIIDGVLLGNLNLTSLDEENDNTLTDKGKWYFNEVWTYPFNTLPLARDIVNGLEFGYRGSPAFEFGKHVVNSASLTSKIWTDKEVTRQDIKTLFMTLGFLGHIPTRQSWITGEFIHDWVTHESDPNSMDFISEGLIKGKKEK